MCPTCGIEILVNDILGGYNSLDLDNLRKTPRVRKSCALDGKADLAYEIRLA